MQPSIKIYFIPTRPSSGQSRLCTAVNIYSGGIQHEHSSGVGNTGLQHRN